MRFLTTVSLSVTVVQSDALIRRKRSSYSSRARSRWAKKPSSELKIVASAPWKGQSLCVFDFRGRGPVVLVRVGIGNIPHLVAEGGLDLLEGWQKRVGVGVVDAEHDLLAVLRTGRKGDVVVGLGPLAAHHTRVGQQTAGAAGSLRPHPRGGYVAFRTTRGNSGAARPGGDTVVEGSQSEWCSDHRRKRSRQCGPDRSRRRDGGRRILSCGSGSGHRRGIPVSFSSQARQARWSLRRPGLWAEGDGRSMKPYKKFGADRSGDGFREKEKAVLSGY
ncbi:hypothetical protein PG995_012123 [Apiospora arundinis]